jgi:hypothetical protein
LDDPKFSNQATFLGPKKKKKLIFKQEFDMENKSNGSD